MFGISEDEPELTPSDIRLFQLVSLYKRYIDQDSDLMAIQDDTVTVIMLNKEVTV